MTSKLQNQRSNEDPTQAPAFQSYQDGLRALQERKFEKARTLFQKAVKTGPRELAERARVHLNTCDLHLHQSQIEFTSPAEHYDFAISLINIGDYVNAREHVDSILREAPQADYAWYGLAVLDCLTSHFENSLKALQEAIRLNPGNRFQARNDSDFKNLADDPRFTELLYPESGAEMAMPGYGR
jgi:tetratricopeptide (TPR) repeat protein